MAVVALGVGLTACNNDEIDGPQDGQKGNTHVSVTLKMSSKLRSAGTGLPDEYNPVGTWAGKDKFDKIKIYLVDGSSVTSSEFTVGTDYEVVPQTDGSYYLRPLASAAMRTTAGQKTVYVVVNETPAVRDWLNKTPVHEFEQAYKNLPLLLTNSGTSTTAVETSASKLAKKNTQDESIVMTTTEPDVLTVVDGVSEEETINEALKENRASVTVERAVARVMVTIKEVPTGGYAIPDPNTNGATNLGILSGITWVVAQGENSLYVQHKKNNPWEWATPNWDWVPTTSEFYAQGTDGSATGNQKYDYSGLFEERNNSFGGTTVPTYEDYAANKGEEPIELETRWLAGKFVLPTTHLYAAPPAVGANYDGGYKKGNTAYVLIRAKFTPEDAAFADDATAKATDGTFYVGKDGKFYTSETNAKDAGNSEVAKYVEGKVLYYAWLNPDRIQNNWYNSPVLRNNIYHIHINGFRNLGTNWNPLYPEDPDNPVMIPDPNNPGGLIPSNPDPRPVPEDPEVKEPENPIDPEDPLTTPETWMSVDVSILPWKVHSYEVSLGI